MTDTSNTVMIGGHRVHLSEPERLSPKPAFIGRDQELRLCRAAWQVSPDGKTLQEDETLRLHFRLEGQPGVGKNEIVYQIARELGLPLYVIQGHDELTPEDLALMLVPDSGSAMTAHVPLVLRASPLATAIYRGGLFFFDEINRVPERSLSPLASVLDDRMCIYSAMTGLRIGPRDEAARKRFRFCCALNPTVTESGMGNLPEYIEQRTLPVIQVGYLPFSELRKIIEVSLRPTPEMLDALEKWHKSRSSRDISVRQALNLVKYSMTHAARENVKPLQAIKMAEPTIFRTDGSSTPKG